MEIIPDGDGGDDGGGEGFTETLRPAHSLPVSSQGGSFVSPMSFGRVLVEIISGIACFGQKNQTGSNAQQSVLGWCSFPGVPWRVASLDSAGLS